jgi:small nuclear ribonucleoprotein (snRNP)-like protein
MTATELRELQDARVVLHLNDGEVLKATITFVDLEYEDVIVDVLETTKPARYKGPKNAAYTVKAADILSVERIPN